MRPLTPMAVSVLALLLEKPMHPYEMYQLLSARHEDELIKVRPGSLYHSVERVCDDGLIAPSETEREGNRPERTVYAITDAGRQAFAERVGEALSTPVNEYPMFPVALSQAHALPAAEVVTLLRRYAATRDAEIADSEKLIAGLAESGLAEAYWFVADYLLTLRRSELEWIRITIDRLEKEELPWPPPQL